MGPRVGHNMTAFNGPMLWRVLGEPASQRERHNGSARGRLVDLFQPLPPSSPPSENFLSPSPSHPSRDDRQQSPPAVTEALSDPLSSCKMGHGAKVIGWTGGGGKGDEGCGKGSVAHARFAAGPKQRTYKVEVRGRDVWLLFDTRCGPVPWNAGRPALPLLLGSTDAFRVVYRLVFPVLFGFATAARACCSPHVSWCGAGGIR